ncbi:MAG: iron ABC transporter permease [Marinisporobacter sp.]|jgi:iron complex transport system permease protein|nr:iron ABC transporter permease [Marinisporobacter sp.]
MINKKGSAYICSFVGILVLIVISLIVGKYSMSLEEVVDSKNYIFSEGSNMPNAAFVILSIRLPRVLMALLIGSSLAVSGASMQALFKNPLASPKILGVFSGSAFGIALGLVVFHQTIYAYFMAFIFGVIAVFMTYKIGKQEKRSSVLLLILAGITVDAFFTALLALVQFNANVETELPSIVYWLMGSLSGVSMNDVKWVVVPIILCLGIIYTLRWKLNILSLSNEEAISLGFNIKGYKVIVIIIVTILSAISVSICGMIGWVGLITPHIGRIFVGTDHEKLIPTCVVLGAVYLLVMDVGCRCLFKSEVPLSILTAFLGAPFFAYLLKCKGGMWQ